MIGILQGLAFVITYSLFGLLAGRLVDRSNRRNLLVVCIGIWSLATACSGLAQSGGELFVARMFVGLGEAALMPAAVSLISDSVPESRRSFALGTFLTGTHLGIGMSLMIVGALLPPLTAMSSVLATQGHVVEPWRMVMMLMLVPGFVCCCLLLMIREPERRVARNPNEKKGDMPSEWSSRIAIYLPHNLAVSCTGLCLFAASGWFPSVLIREFGTEPRTAGLTYGGVIAATGVFSAIVAGHVADRRMAHVGTSGQILIGIVAAPIGAIAFAIIAIRPAFGLLLCAGAIVNLTLVATWVIGLMSLSTLAPALSRGKLTAILLLFNGAIGQGLGPALIGVISDNLRSQGVPLSQILGVVGCVAAILASLFYALSRSALIREGKLSALVPIFAQERTI